MNMQKIRPHLPWITLVVLVAMGLRAIVAGRGALARGLALAFVFWSFAEMTHAAMRIAAISFLFALAFAQIDDQEDTS